MLDSAHGILTGSYLAAKSVVGFIATLGGIGLLAQAAPAGPDQVLERSALALLGVVLAGVGGWLALYLPRREAREAAEHTAEIDRIQRLHEQQLAARDALHAAEIARLQQSFREQLALMRSGLSLDTRADSSRPLSDPPEGFRHD